MTSPNPVQPQARAGNYLDEVSTQTDLNALFRFFATKAMRASLSSPPLAKDIEELTIVYDKTLNRIYTKVNGVLKYVQFS